MATKQVLWSDGCPAEAQNLGIISENDHRVGICLCQFCTCGQHMCPGQRTKLYVPYKSSYKSDFESKRVESPKKQEKPAYKPNSHKMDLKTTHAEVYLPYNSTWKPREKRVHRASKAMSMIANSEHRRKYINWGKYPVHHVKEWHAPLRSTEIPFNANTLYRQNFKQGKGDRVKLSPVRDNINLGKEMVETKSTYSRNMQDYRARLESPTAKPKYSDHRPTSISPTHFNTSSNQFYGNTSPLDTNLRQMRMFLLSRN